MQRSPDTGSWLTTTPDYQNGTVLSAEEFRDSLRLRLGLDPVALPHRCDGCEQRFTVEHAMCCKKGGLVTLRHNDVMAEWHHLCALALTPSVVSDEPLINTGRDNREEMRQSAEPPKELRGDVSVHGFWAKGQTAIFDIRVTDVDARSYRSTDTKKVLRRHEEEKKKLYNDACLARRRSFTPLVFSVDGLRGQECEAASKRLASLLAAKWSRTYSEVCGFVRSRLALSLARSASRCLRGDRNPVHRSPITGWESGAGLALFR